MSEEEEMKIEAHYRSIVVSQTFTNRLKQYQLYYNETNTNQHLQVHEPNGMTVCYGVLKLYWGTQKVIRLKKEELSWKRKSTRMAYENGLDEKLMNAMGSGARNRRSISKLRDSVSDIPEESSESVVQEPPNEGDNSVFNSDKSSGLERISMINSLPRDGLKINHDIIEEMNSKEHQGGFEMPSKELSLTMPKKIPRRTLSFSGHQYNSKTRIFRPRYGTPSSVRVTSTETTQTVIKQLLDKFAVENSPEEYSLFSVSNSGGTQELKLDDFPLIKRIEFGPDENITKIYIMEKQTETVTMEVAQYANLPVPTLQAILKKYTEEEEKEVGEIKKRYSIYQATLNKKMEAVGDRSSSYDTKL